MLAVNSVDNKSIRHDLVNHDNKMVNMI